MINQYRPYHGSPPEYGLLIVILSLLPLPRFLFINDLFHEVDLFELVIKTIEKNPSIADYNIILLVIDLSFMLFGIIQIVTSERVYLWWQRVIKKQKTPN